MSNKSIGNKAFKTHTKYENNRNKSVNNAKKYGYAKGMDIVNMNKKDFNEYVKYMQENHKQSSNAIKNNMIHGPLAHGNYKSIKQEEKRSNEYRRNLTKGINERRNKTKKQITSTRKKVSKKK